MVESSEVEEACLTDENDSVQVTVKTQEEKIEAVRHAVKECKRDQDRLKTEQDEMDTERDQFKTDCKTYEIELNDIESDLSAA